MKYSKSACFIGDDQHPGICYYFEIWGLLGTKEINLYHDVVDDKWFGDTIDSDGWHDLDPEDLTRYVTMIKDEINKNQ